MGTGSRFVAALLALALSTVLQAAERPNIRFAEKVTVNAGTAQSQFDAYGRRFVLNLQSNDRALATLKLKQATSIDGVRLWRGTLEGQEGSWVRLTERGGASEGVIWDGSDLYVVTPYEKVATSLSVPLTAQAGDTVIFRLSDSTNLLPDGYCGTGPSPDGLESNNGLVQYRNMVAELQVRAQAMAIATSSRQIEISMIADSAMAARGITDPIAAMLTSYNIVDGIYAEQLGLLIIPTDMRSIPAAGDPFTATNGSNLLAQLIAFRQNTPAVAALGIAHLFTGHDLDDDVVGIARIGGACSVENGVSLTEGWRASWSAALVMAHEIGHNFGAEHDGTGACAAVTSSYIMWPTTNGSQQFSQCSIDAISSFIASASCVTPANYSKVELPQTNVPLFGELDEPLVVPFELHSTGTRAVNDVTLNVRVHESLTLTATTPGVTCAVSPSQNWTIGVNCDVGSIPAGTVKRVELTFLPGLVASTTTEATVSASNNQNTRNTTQNGSINVRNNVDVSVAVATSATTATFGDMVDVTLTLRSLRSHTARNVRVGVYGGGLRGESFDVPAGVTCQLDATNPGQTFCIVGDIPGGETRTIVVHSRASQVGINLQGNAYLSADNDPEYSNNNAYFTMQSIAAAHDVGLEDLTTSAPVQFNMPFEYRANLRSYGSQPVDGVRVVINLFMQDSAALNSVSSVTVGGNTCNKLANWNYECIIGTMAAGEVLPLSISGIATGLGETRVTLNSYATINDNPWNDQVYRGWIVRYGLDASVTFGSRPFPVEGLEDSGSVQVWSNGTQASNNAVLNLELPPQVRLTRFWVQSPGTTSCAIVDPQHLRCTYNIPSATSYQDVSYFVTSDVAGAYQASATLTLAGDENPANNSVQWQFSVSAAIDAGVRAASTIPQYLFVGRDLTIPLEVFTGSRPVSGASLNVTAHTNVGLTSVSTSQGTCTRTDAIQFRCALGDLAGGSTVNVSAVVTAGSTAGTGFFYASAGATGENVGSNNNLSRSITVVPVSDARVAVAATAFTATAGTVFSLPSISVWRQGEIVDGRLTITLPAGASISSMSGSVFSCSGTTTLECALPSSWPESQGIQVDLQLLTPTAGSFVVTSRVSAANDSSSANDEASIALTVNAAAPPPPPPPSSGGGGSSSGGGGGGGGRIEWPIAFLLGLMLIRRQRLRVLNPRRGID